MTSTRWTSPEWICTQPGLPTKTMTGIAPPFTASRTDAGGGRRDRAGELGAGETHRLEAADAEAAEEAEELVGVLEGAPGGDEAARSISASGRSEAASGIGTKAAAAKSAGAAPPSAKSATSGASAGVGP